MHFLTRALTALVLVGSIAACSAPASKPESTLYDRLGGKEAISAVVGKLYAIVAADDRINGRFANVSAEAFGPLLTDFLCEAAGGPCKYQGRDMKTTHTGMNLTDAEFDALAEDAIAALDHFKVPKRESDEVINMLASLRGDVVGH
jgi:hemoglobin